MNDKFLEAYRQLDIELKEQGQSVLDYENSLSDGTDKERLKLCRITRNYLSHQDKKFVTCSKEMIKFIEDLTLQIRRKSHTVKDELIRQKTAKHNETLKNILPLISKNPVPITQKDKVIYILTKDEYLTWLAKGMKKVELPKRLPKLNYITKDDKYKDLSQGIYIVTSDGTIDGKYQGICIV